MSSQPEILHRFANGDELRRQDHALIACLSGRRKVLSTAAHNGGFRTDLRWVFNQDCNHGTFELKAPTYAEHMALVAAELGLDPAFSCGLSTAANMNNVAIANVAFADTTVTAVVTGGVDVNGGRVGDVANWNEAHGQFIYTPGTINILLFIDADLTEGALARALVTCTEAKTAALQELLAPSCTSSGIATGSGTDGTVIVANAESPVKLTAAGKHCKLGELIGRTVRAAVKEALFLQTGLCAAQQMDIFSRLGRFGVTRDRLLAAVGDRMPDPEAFSEKLTRLAVDPDLVVPASLFAHLLDQLQWGLLDARQVIGGSLKILKSMGMRPVVSPAAADPESAAAELVQACIHGLADLLTRP